MRPDIDQIATGHWQTILTSFGIGSEYLRNKHGPCPLCGGSDRFRFDNRDGRGTYFCSQCGSGNGMQLATRYANLDFNEAYDRITKLVEGKAPKAWRAKADQDTCMKAIIRAWQSGQEATNLTGPVQAYLKKRTGRHWASNSLRECTAIWNNHEQKHFPAMVWKVASPEGKAINLHITHLTSTGEKAQIERAKLFMAGTIPEGSAIRLMKEAPVMGVAEGVETALAASIMFGMPVWATGNATLLAKWVPPELAEKITIFGDNDESFTGHAKAYALANRLTVQFKKQVDVKICPEIGKDFADMLGLK